MTEVLKVAAARALNGERVMICGHNRANALSMLNQVEHHLAPESYTRYRAHGQKRIATVNGGHISIMSARQPSTIRGAHITYLVLDDHRPLLDQMFMEEVMPAFGALLHRIAVIG